MTTGIVQGVPGGAALSVHVQPGARRAAVAGRHGDALKVKVAAPPVDGRANEAVVALLADLFDLSPSAVELRSGSTSRSKRFVLHGADPAAVDATVVALLGRGGPPPAAGPEG